MLLCEPASTEQGEAEVNSRSLAVCGIWWWFHQPVHVRRSMVLGLTLGQQALQSSNSSLLQCISYTHFKGSKYSPTLEVNIEVKIRKVQTHRCEGMGRGV